MGIETWAVAGPVHQAVVAGWLAEVPEGAWLSQMSPGAALASETVRLRTYARIKPDGTRETWRETVIRCIAYLRHRGLQRVGVADVELFDAELALAARAVLMRQVMPSMRLLWGAGDVIERNDIALYNCAFAVVDTPAVFHEALLVLMHGTGFGFSVESQFVSKLPKPDAPRHVDCVPAVHVIEDSTEGWARAVELGVRAWFTGLDLAFDASQVRPHGAPLRTKGGEASGPEPLLSYLSALRTAIQRAGREGRQLRPIEAHDLLCAAGAIVRVGGVRRSAMISFSDRDDDEMRLAKHFPSGPVDPVRYQANNSWVIEDPDALTWGQFCDEWDVLVSSGAGERGIVSPSRASYRGVAVRGNPCMEIWLAFLLARAAWDGSGGGQFCNLTNIILRLLDTVEDATEKARLAAFLGTIQASMTDFNGLREGWTEVTRRDALLGVGLAGQADCQAVAGDVDALKRMNATAIEANEHWARILGINPAAGVTCGKPDGNGSVLLGCGSGIHPHHAQYYLRRIQIDAKSPICALLRAYGMPAIPTDQPAAEALDAAIARGDVAAAGALADAVKSWSFEFPIESPAGALLRDDEGALGLLKRIETINRGWLGVKGHNQSATVSVRGHEWDAVRDYVWENRANMGGLSFWPLDENRYHATPLSDLTPDEYAARVAALPVIDWSALAQFETGVSEGPTTFACAGGACQIV